ncbi:hypothetical protein [Streptomyces sp. URMC 129]|uniref:hypothetical protein n=1 Tax=Streptomyces sp. URMC 129 TaxID=3423407 RepID=UPI003F1C1171
MTDFDVAATKAALASAGIELHRFTRADGSVDWGFDRAGLERMQVLLRLAGENDRADIIGRLLNNGTLED